jgi:chaperonin cofactor prefoldin
METPNRRTAIADAKERLERVERRNESLRRNGDRVVSGLRRTAEMLRAAQRREKP